MVQPDGERDLKLFIGQDDLYLMALTGKTQTVFLLYISNTV